MADRQAPLSRTEILRLLDGFRAVTARVPLAQTCQPWPEERVFEWMALAAAGFFAAVGLLTQSEQSGDATGACLALAIAGVAYWGRRRWRRWLRPRSAGGPTGRWRATADADGFALTFRGRTRRVPWADITGARWQGEALVVSVAGDKPLRVPGVDAFQPILDTALTVANRRAAEREARLASMDRGLSPADLDGDAERGLSASDVPLDA